MKQNWMNWMLFMTVIVSCLFVISPVTLTKEIKQEWEILNPKGVIKIEAMKGNPHPLRLEGKTVMLRWNGKHNGEKFLERVGELLKERVKDVKVIKSWEVAPETVDPITGNQERSQEFAKAIAKFKPDLVIGTQSDWGACTSWLVVDQLNLEKMGVPTVTISSSEFVGLAKDTALGQGAADLSFVIVPHPMGMIPIEEIRKKADLVFPEILKMSTEWKPEAKLPPMKPVYPAGRLKLKGSVEDINKIFFEKGLSLGLPILPLTPDHVAEILKGTSRKPDELLGMVPPRMGALTVV